jgi:hypothetical protein
MPGVVRWITQLVVDASVRKHYIATQLLQTLKAHPLFQSVTIVGLVSSHPAACNALAKYAGTFYLYLVGYDITNMHWQDVDVYDVDLNFIHDIAADVLASSPIDYLRDVQLSGRLFVEGDSRGAVSCVFTKFYVEHREPLEALEKFKAKGQWCLGELLDGHEYLALFPVPALSPIEPFH